MYRWYARSAVCYAVLEDLYTDKDSTTSSELEKCRWFSRGWTLQELLAPKKLIFLNAGWMEVGSKLDKSERQEFTTMLARITKIDPLTLLGLSPKRLSIAQRMSWASQRQTSRPEDIAYSLFGLFGVTLPLLYGEGGDKAFIRLQEEILRNTDDHTIFAWSTKAVRSSINSAYYGLLAPSPACFNWISSSRYVERKNQSPYLCQVDPPIPIRDSEVGTDHAITSRGVYLKGMASPSCTLLIFSCRPGNVADMLFVIPIIRLRTGPNDFARPAEPSEPGLTLVSVVKERDLEQTEIYVRSSIYEPDFLEQYLINYVQFSVLPDNESEYYLEDWYPPGRYNNTSMILQTSPFPHEPCGGILLFKNTSSPKQVCFAVAIFGEYDLDNTDCIYRDFVGVYKTTKDARDFYHEDFAGWFSKGTQEAHSGAATRIVRGGREAWKLDDETFVRVVINRNRDAFIGTMAIAQIYAGSWERDILDQENEYRSKEL